MQDQYTQLPWEQPAWFEHVTAWIQTQLTEYGWHARKPVEWLHQRPWSAFARVVTDKGLVYFKAPAPMFKYEVALTQALARWRPDCTAPLLAVNLEQGWLLSADAGETLRSVSRSPDQIQHWLKLLPQYVELQLQMVAHVPELLALGVLDRRLAALPHLYEQLIDDTENLRVGMDPGLSPEEYQRLHNWRSHFADLCEQLAGYGLPETLTHEEIHENNVLVRDGRYTFTDWSDSSISHPFFSMLVTLRTIVHWLKLDESSAEVAQVRDAYLEPWTKFETRSNLSAAFELAYRLGMVNRALSWHHGMGTLPKKHKEPYADSVPGWLQDFLEAETGYSEIIEIDSV